MPIVPTCHPNRAHQAKGLCNSCYMKQYDRKRGHERKDPSEFAANYRRPPTQIARTPDCHPERPHVALGMCRACYQKDRPDRPRATCHPDRPLVAREMCNACLKAEQYDRDPEKVRTQVRQSQAKIRARNRTEIIAAYGGKCACPRCPEFNPAFLTLEHVGGTGAKHRKQVGSHAYADLRRRGYPKEGFTLLCWNCNAMIRFGGPCPHMLAGDQ